MDAKRVVFLDYLRVIAIFMVMVVHSCEQFYFGPDGGFLIKTPGDARWVVGLDSAVRACVPLFVMASAYLLFPVTRPTGEFLRRRLLRVGVPFALWCCVYNWWNGGTWGTMLFNFPSATGGHLWFVPMLFGLYLAMPLLSPWAEKATKKELLGWIAVWLFTTTFPFLRGLWATLYGNGWTHVFGEGNFDHIPFLYGECGWNSFGTFQYVSGFFGYMLLGLYARKFLGELTWKRTLSAAVPLWAAGYAIVFCGFFFRIAKYGATYPVSAGYAAAVDLETSWEFCSTGVALTVMAYFLVIRKLVADGAFYRCAIRPLSAASFGVYLVHILVLVPVCGALSPRLGTGATILGTATATFLISSAFAYAVHRLPKVGKWIVG